MMISYILCICFISLTVFGEELHEHHNLQLILKEMDLMKKMLQHNSEKLIEIDYLRERTLVLENEVEGLKHENHNLNQKVKTLERQCAQRPVEDVNETEKSDTTNIQKYAYEQTFELKKRTSHFNRQRSMISGQTSLQANIAFTAGVSVENLHNLGHYQTIIFDQVITNIGNAYHEHTGIFTVPVKGAYVITLTMTVEPNKVQWLDLVVDGVYINYISAGLGSTDNYASTTKQWILELDTGSEVWFRKTSDNNDQDLHGNMNTIMSGFLLFQT
ncbi:uncharacterized protein LOC132746157 [Ruditapes philippinarum]|uniref:uncharacterized protein LOC132746157 n=1 Tax=Ruditapes philippinarum TaxID=129788 RepID=UPI00295AD8CA|nr:uncharacterized protein LOC132746157 [Ruditapes philippinarum]